MSKSKVVTPIVGSKKKDRGKRGRKVGKGIHKLSHSRWGSYATLIAHQASLRLARLSRGYCRECETQFHSVSAKKRHECKIS